MAASKVMQNRTPHQSADFKKTQISDLVILPNLNPFNFQSCSKKGKNLVLAACEGWW